MKKNENALLIRIKHLLNYSVTYSVDVDRVIDKFYYIIHAFGCS